MPKGRGFLGVLVGGATVKQRVKRLYRVRAEYGPGYVVTRDYQSEKAAQERAVRMLEGRAPEFDPTGGEIITEVPPAVRVTIAISEPVIFGPPTEFHPNLTEGEPS